MVLMADRGLLGDRPEAAIFANTMNEPGSVLRWLPYLELQLERIPIHVVYATRGSGNLRTENLRVHTTKDGQRRYWKDYIPFFTVHHKDGKHGMYRRKCTADFKIAPITRKAREIVGREDMLAWRKEYRATLQDYRNAQKLPAWETLTTKEKATFSKEFVSIHRENRFGPRPIVEQWIGISTDEADRMKPAAEPWIKNRWPLIELGFSRADCLEWMKARGYLKPPRSACTFCPYHSDAEWLSLTPEEFTDAVELEREAQKLAAECKTTWGVPYLHASRVPLDRVEFKKGDTKNRFSDECEGMCGN